MAEKVRKKEKSSEKVVLVAPEASGARVYQLRSRQLRDLTYDERKKISLKEGKEVTFLTCPLCGRNRPLNIWGRRAVFEFKPDYAIIQIRKGGGRGYGFFLVLDKSLKLNDPEFLEKYWDVFLNLKEEVRKLYEFLEKIA
jgi:hypothetical protein